MTWKSVAVTIASMIFVAVMMLYLFLLVQQKYISGGEFLTLVGTLLGGGGVGAHGYMLRSKSPAAPSLPAAPQPSGETP